MSRKKTQTPEYQWEQAMLEAYDDYRYKEVLDPLYEEFQRWKAGELSHGDMDQAIHRTHKQMQKLFGIFTMKRDWLVRTIMYDEPWYQAWVKDCPPPEGYPGEEASNVA